VIRARFLFLEMVVAQACIKMMHTTLLLSKFQTLNLQLTEHPKWGHKLAIKRRNKTHTMHIVCYWNDHSVIVHILHYSGFAKKKMFKALQVAT
jgi:hypothetical protein